MKVRVMTIPSQKDKVVNSIRSLRSGPSLVDSLKQSTAFSTVTGASVSEPSTTEPPASTSKDKKSKGGMIAGVVIGVIAAIALAVAAVFYRERFIKTAPKQVDAEAGNLTFTQNSVYENSTYGNITPASPEAEA